MHGCLLLHGDVDCEALALLLFNLPPFLLKQTNEECKNYENRDHHHYQPPSPVPLIVEALDFVLKLFFECLVMNVMVSGKRMAQRSFHDHWVTVEIREV